MKGYRYNAKKRTDRDYNRTGREKNPNAVKFYAKTLEYAENYRYVYMADGDIAYECELEVVDIHGVKLFDMTANYKSLKTYRDFVNSSIEIQLKDYQYYLSKAKKAKDKKFWQNQIENLKNREQEIESMLMCYEFQCLSDFEWQNQLIAELKSMGFDGYHTRREIAIF